MTVTTSPDRVAPPGEERNERAVRQCVAIEPDGTQCKIFSQHERCFRHRRQQTDDRDEEDEQ